MSDNSLVVYRPYDSYVEIPLRSDIDNRTVWATQKQIAQMLNIDVKTVSHHIQNFKEQRGSRADRSISKFQIVTEDGKSRDVEHYDATAIVFIGFRAQATDEVIYFQDWIGEIVEEHFAQKQIAYTPAQQILMIAQHMVDLEQQAKQTQLTLAAQNQQIKQLEARQDAVDHFFTVSAWANLTHKHPSKADYQKIGRFASKYSKSHNYNIASVPDPKYGQVNCYHEDVLTIAFENWRTQNPLFDGDY